MITVDSKSRSNRYRIMESAVSFTENYQNTNLKGNPIYDVVSVSIASNASIMVYDTNNGIDFGADLQYKRWRLSGATTGLASPEAHNIYAKLSKSNDNLVGEIIFSTLNYTTKGVSEETNEDGNPLKDYSDSHWMIKIGTLSALTNPNSSTPDRTLTFDPGQLGTQKDNNEKGAGLLAKMFDLVMTDPERIKPLLWFEELSVKFESFFESIANFYSGIRIGSAGNSKELTSVATDASADEDDDKAVSTPAYVKAFSEARYLRYDIEGDQTVNGTVNFRKNVSVVGEHSVGGNQTIAGDQSVGGDHTVGGGQTVEGRQTIKGLQTLHEGLMTPNFNDAGGQIVGAHLTKDGLFSVAGLIANSFTIKELIYNVIRAQGGEYVYSPTVNIDTCSFLVNRGTTSSPVLETMTIAEYYAAYTHADWERISEVYLTLRDDECTHKGNPLLVGDIVYGYVNDIGESGQHATGGQCLMHVTAIDDLNVTAALYQKGQYGLVANIPPAEGMTIAQRGTEDANNPERMTSFYISAEDGSIIMLDRVNSPVLSADNYGATLGKLPTDLFYKIQGYFSYIKQTDPVVYARYGIFENLLQFDHLGQPIKRENNRGEWDAEIAARGEYSNTESYYDTVTYNGELWKCVADGTTDTPSQGVGWLLLVSKGADGADGKDGADGTSIHIKGSYSSVDAFLAAWQNTDGSWKAPADDNDCYIVVANLYVWDDSSWIDVGQFKGADGKSYAGNLLDNTDFSKVEENGMPVGWERYNTEEETSGGYYSVSVQDATMLLTARGRQNKLLIRHTVSGKLFESSWYTLSFYVKKTGTRTTRLYVFIDNVDLSTYYVSEGLEYEISYGLFDTQVSDVWEKVYITFKTLQEAADIAIGFGAFVSRAEANVMITQLKLEYVENQDSPNIAKPTDWTPSATDLKGKDGKDGEIGASIYQAGAWDANRIYKKENNCTPVVSYKAIGEDKKKYYILNVDESTGSVPNELVHWKAFQYFEYLWAEFLLANFATLGGDNGAVFYDRYQFSQRGHGNKRYSDYASVMFNNEGKFTGEYIPKLHFDFVSGLANLSCLCEPYQTPTPENGVIRIDMNGGFNVKVPYPDIDLSTYVKPYAMMPVVVLPQFIDGEEWAKNGSHVTVLFESGGEQYGNFINVKSGSALLRKSLFLLVCVDDPMQQVDGISYPSFSWSGENYIMHKGRRSKYIILAPGNSVRFKATETNGCLYWTIDAEASVTEQKVDFYSSLYGASLPEHGLPVYSKDYRRVQFYGADYSTISNLSSSYYDDSGSTRGLMLYAGMEGFCPRNIIFSTSNDGEFHYRILSYTDIDGDFVSMYGPTLSD